MKTKHTEGEWIIIYRKDDNFGKPINVPETIRVKNWENNDLMGDYQGCIICSFNESHGNRAHAYKETEANAKFIVKACNSHYELLEALQELIECDFTSGTHLSCAILKAKQAIKKATE